MENNQQKDPTYNVIELVESSIKRLDDLREREVKRIDEKICDNDAKYQLQFNGSEKAAAQRFEAQQLALKDALISQEKAVAAALEGTKEAIIKNDANTDKRFDLLSEKIDGVIETTSKNIGERGIYVTHTDLNVAMDKLQVSIEATLRPVVTFMNNNQGKSTGVEMTWGRIAMIVGIISAIVALIFRFNI